MNKILQKKTKSFTIIEMMITILISSLSVAFALGIYLLIDNYFQRLKEKNEKSTELLLLYNTMKHDFESSTGFAFQNTELNCIKSGNEKISYQFENNFVVRTNQIRDTFKVKLNEITVNKESNVYLFSFSAKTAGFESDFDFILFKNYSNEQIFNLKKQVSNVN